MEVTVMKLSGRATLNVELVDRLLNEKAFDESTGLGFRDVDIELDSYVVGIALKRTPVYLRLYDSFTGSTVEREEFLMNEVSFRIDCKRNLVEIYANSKNVKRLIDVFSALLLDQLELEQITIKAHQVLSAMHADEKRYEVKKLDIREFSSERGVTGNYDIRTIENGRAWDFVAQYRSQIRTATVQFLDLGTEALIHVFDNGRFKIASRPRSANEDLLISLKSFLQVIQKEDF